MNIKYLSILSAFLLTSGNFSYAIGGYGDNNGYSDATSESLGDNGNNGSNGQNTCFGKRQNKTNEYHSFGGRTRQNKIEYNTDCNHSFGGGNYDTQTENRIKIHGKMNQLKEGWYDNIRTDLNIRKGCWAFYYPNAK